MKTRMSLYHKGILASAFTFIMEANMQRVELYLDLFDLILYIPSTIFQLCRDGSSWVEPVLSQDKCVLLKDTTQ